MNRNLDGKGLLILLALFAVFSAARAVERKGNTVSFNGISFRFDPALASSVDVYQFAGDPLTNDPMTNGEPPYTQLLLYNKRPAPESAFEETALGVIRVYRAEAFKNYSFSAAEFIKLQKLLKDKPAATSIAAGKRDEAVLPFMPVLPAGQAIRARVAYVNTSALDGIAYLTAYQSALEPFTGSSFMYTFQGISKDGAYYVSVFARLNTDLFPKNLPASDPAKFADEHLKYIADTTAKLNAASPQAFTPALPLLDSVVQSIAVK
ncbi:MAG: hypothetical protein IT324_10060 [Anaerolineae bacterium]|nr:hypothetical protein [Anaerolineae bacterium]